MNLNPFVYSQRLMQKAEMETFKKEDSFRVMQIAAKSRRGELQFFTKISVFVVVLFGIPCIKRDLRIINVP